MFDELQTQLPFVCGIYGVAAFRQNGQKHFETCWLVVNDENAALLIVRLGISHKELADSILSIMRSSCPYWKLTVRGRSVSGTSLFTFAISSRTLWIAATLSSATAMRNFARSCAGREANALVTAAGPLLSETLACRSSA